MKVWILTRTLLALARLQERIRQSLGVDAPSHDARRRYVSSEERRSTVRVRHVTRVPRTSSRPQRYFSVSEDLDGDSDVKYLG